MPNIYEEVEILHEYLLFHYGHAEEILPYDFGPVSALNYPIRTVSECIDHSALSLTCTALDLGCAVGRSSFELARYCAHVTGVDFSHNFITAAQNLARDGHLNYRRKIVGNRYADAIAQVPAEIQRDRVHFRQGDAMHLPTDLGAFDIVHAANLLCRLPEPAKLLNRLPQLVKAGGQLILTTPHTWLETFTPTENWLAGQIDRAEDPLAGLKRYLDPHFELVRHFDMPFLIREHSRKFQWSVAQASVWKRKTT